MAWSSVRTMMACLTLSTACIGVKSAFLSQTYRAAHTPTVWNQDPHLNRSPVSPLSATKPSRSTSASGSESSIFGEDSQYFTPLVPSGAGVSSSASAAGTQQRITLTRFLQQVVKEQPELGDLESLLLSIQMACKTISNLVNRAGLVYGTDRFDTTTPQESIRDGRFYSMKRLDQLSTEVLRNALEFTGKVHVTVPQSIIDAETPALHQPGVLIAKAVDTPYVACLDPLDGSGNADAAICTGTVFGVFAQQDENEETAHASSTSDEALVNAVLQPACNMRAAGYCLYSSATVLVFTLGDGVVNGFTLDPSMKEFVLTHKNLTIPKRGDVYSCNEANSEGWDSNYQDYLRAIKTGENESKQRYAHRYVGSMVGDIHRTLLYGGVFAYPRDSVQHPDGNLQLLYKSAPMAFVVHQAGGRAIDGETGDLLQVQPERVHQKSPCFMGSPEDVDELETYLSRK